MASSDKMLHCLVDDSECLYRIQRDVDQDSSRIVYVYVRDPTIIPENARTHGPSLLKHLREYSEWNQLWTTLTIRNDNGQIQCVQDASPPHELRRAECPGDYPLLQIAQLQTLQEFKQRVSQVQSGSDTCILKIATFAHEIPSLRQEVKVYHFLATRRSTLVPRLLGYACEQERIVGFLCKMVVGHVPSTDDADACQRGLERLHREGVIHRDINKYNILITAEGPKFIDLEHATVCLLEGNDCSNAKGKDIEDLMLALDDKSGLGQPWKK
ncbi:hypothetical protein BU26DRAFT_514278 [Trematosphaeria pertusa]|uniref:Protein kinase domain-containing protein n=1 Tax=Trematosphaeria pertusa TaxID=390896 RepID=A0A6A6IVR0_9PLEO|nr:uncharacterized protein BU26DRAFT_514278 [Trematosphaeria pertusa]KAF2254348.1 hypothetical protein BU26DRAFT_514278 [Trematosphaeria pertusa]